MSTHDMRGLVQTLMVHAAPHLTAEDLREIGNLDEDARVLASNAGTVAEGIAGIVAYDGQTEVGAGNFQGADEVASLLIVLAGVFSTIAGMIDAAGLARDQLQRGGAA